MTQRLSRMLKMEAKERDQEKKNSVSIQTILSGLFIAALGGAFSYGGFQFGLRRQLERAKHEFDDRKVVEVDPNKVGPSGVPAKQLAMKAFIRGSAVAFTIAGLAGFGLSYVVEANHKGVPKEQEERELQELYRAMGIADEIAKDESTKQ